MDSRSDVVIVGAGASAGVAALALAQGGLLVTCFEQGDWPERDTFGGDDASGELIGMKRWSSLPRVRAGQADYPIDDAASDMAALNWGGVGGGSVLYNGQWPRLLPSDFRVRSDDGVGADWPLTYAELQPFYEETDRQFGVSGLGGNPMYPAGEDPPLPPLPIGPPGMAVAREHARRGWHWWPDNNAILSVEHDGRHACVQRGSCGQGCSEGAKASTDLTHWPRFRDAGGTLITGAAVRRVLVGRDDRATGVEWVDRDGRTHVHFADVVLCAANGIGTPRLLLASADQRHPDGLANDSGLVGRGLMLHPMDLVEGVREAGPPWVGHNGGLINSLEFYRSDPARGFLRGARWALTAGGLPLQTALTRRVGWGAEHHRRMREHVGRRVQWVLLAEDLPEDDNRVTLTESCDAYGVPGVHIAYRISDNTDRLLRWHAEKAIESLEGAGISDIAVTRARANGHFMGTARMGDDPTTSVCDRWGFSHRVRNLGVIDGSLFPTAGGMNPTTTICALALRSARRLLDERGAERLRVRDVPVSAAVPLRLERRRSVATAGLTADERRALARVADELLPGDDVMPPASAVGVADALADAVLAVRPDLLEPVRYALTEVERAAADPARSRVLTTFVAGAYYLSPEVREALDWHVEQGRVLGSPAFPEYVEDGLLDHLLDA